MKKGSSMGVLMPPHTGLSGVHFLIFGGIPKLFYGMSRKSDGPMDIKNHGDLALWMNAQANRQKFLDYRGINPSFVVAPKLEHGNNVAVVSSRNWGDEFYADALVTGVREICLIMAVRDCPVIFFSDPIRKIVAIAHSGWRSTAGGIARHVVQIMCANGSRAEYIYAGVGPGIGQCHFEVRDDVAARFRGYSGQYIRRGKGKFSHVDLPGYIQAQLIEAGLRRQNVELWGECTYCSSDCYSFRRDGDPPRSMLGYIVLKR